MSWKKVGKCWKETVQLDFRQWIQEVSFAVHFAKRWRSEIRPGTRHLVVPWSRQCHVVWYGPGRPRWPGSGVQEWTLRARPPTRHNPGALCSQGVFEALKFSKSLLLYSYIFLAFSSIETLVGTEGIQLPPSQDLSSRVQFGSAAAAGLLLLALLALAQHWSIPAIETAEVRSLCWSHDKKKPMLVAAKLHRHNPLQLNQPTFVGDFTSKTALSSKSSTLSRWHLKWHF